MCGLQAGIGAEKGSYLVPASHPRARRDEDGSPPLGLGQRRRSVEVAAGWTCRHRGRLSKLADGSILI